MQPILETDTDLVFPSERGFYLVPKMNKRRAITSSSSSSQLFNISMEQYPTIESIGTSLFKNHSYYMKPQELFPIDATSNLLAVSPDGLHYATSHSTATRVVSFREVLFPIGSRFATTATMMATTSSSSGSPSSGMRRGSTIENHHQHQENNNKNNNDDSDDDEEQEEEDEEENSSTPEDREFDMDEIVRMIEQIPPRVPSDDDDDDDDDYDDDDDDDVPPPLPAIASPTTDNDDHRHHRVTFFPNDNIQNYLDPNNTHHQQPQIEQQYATRIETKTTTKHASRSARVTVIVFSPDSKMIAAGTNDQNILVWEVATNKSLSNFTEHDAPITTISWRQDSKVIASGCQKGTIIVWQILTQEVLHCFRPSGPRNSRRTAPLVAANTNRITFCEFSPFSYHILVVHVHSEKLSLWALDSGFEDKQKQNDEDDVEDELLMSQFDEEHFPPDGTNALPTSTNASSSIKRRPPIEFLATKGSISEATCCKLVTVLCEETEKIFCRIITGGQSVRGYDVPLEVLSYNFYEDSSPPLSCCCDLSKPHYSHYDRAAKFAQTSDSVWMFEKIHQYVHQLPPEQQRSQDNSILSRARCYNLSAHVGKTSSTTLIAGRFDQSVFIWRLSDCKLLSVVTADSGSYFEFVPFPRYDLHEFNMRQKREKEDDSRTRNDDDDDDDCNEERIHPLHLLARQDNVVATVGLAAIRSGTGHLKFFGLSHKPLKHCEFVVSGCSSDVHRPLLLPQKQQQQQQQQRDSGNNRNSSHRPPPPAPYDSPLALSTSVSNTSSSPVSSSSPLPALSSSTEARQRRALAFLRDEYRSESTLFTHHHHGQSNSSKNNNKNNNHANDDTTIIQPYEPTSKLNHENEHGTYTDRRIVAIDPERRWVLGASDKLSSSISVFQYPDLESTSSSKVKNVTIIDEEILSKADEKSLSLVASDEWKRNDTLTRRVLSKSNAPSACAYLEIESYILLTEDNNIDRSHRQFAARIHDICFLPHSGGGDCSSASSSSSSSATLFAVLVSVSDENSTNNTNTDHAGRSSTENKEIKIVIGAILNVPPFPIRVGCLAVCPVTKRESSHSNPAFAKSMKLFVSPSSNNKLTFSYTSEVLREEIELVTQEYEFDIFESTSMLFGENRNKESNNNKRDGDGDDEKWSVIPSTIQRAKMIGDLRSMLCSAAEKKIFHQTKRYLNAFRSSSISREEQQNKIDVITKILANRKLLTTKPKSHSQTIEFVKIAGKVLTEIELLFSDSTSCVPSKMKAQKNVKNQNDDNDSNDVDNYNHDSQSSFFPGPYSSYKVDEEWHSTFLRKPTFSSAASASAAMSPSAQKRNIDYNSAFPPSSSCDEDDDDIAQKPESSSVMSSSSMKHEKRSKREEQKFPINIHTWKQVTNKLNSLIKNRFSKVLFLAPGVEGNDDDDVDIDKYHRYAAEAASKFIMSNLVSVDDGNTNYDNSNSPSEELRLLLSLQLIDCLWEIARHMRIIDSLVLKKCRSIYYDSAVVILASSNAAERETKEVTRISDRFAKIERQNNMSSFSMLLQLVARHCYLNSIITLQKRYVQAPANPFYTQNDFLIEKCFPVLPSSLPSEVSEIIIINNDSDDHEMNRSDSGNGSPSSSVLLPQSPFGLWRRCIIQHKDGFKHLNTHALVHCFDFSLTTDRVGYFMEQKMRTALRTVPGVDTKLFETVIPARSMFDNFASQQEYYSTTRVSSSSASASYSPSFFIGMVIAVPHSFPRPLTKENLTITDDKMPTNDYSTTALPNTTTMMAIPNSDVEMQLMTTLLSTISQIFQVCQELVQDKRRTLLGMMSAVIVDNENDDDARNPSTLRVLNLDKISELSLQYYLRPESFCVYSSTSSTTSSTMRISIIDVMSIAFAASPHAASGGDHAVRQKIASFFSRPGSSQQKVHDDAIVTKERKTDQLMISFPVSRESSALMNRLKERIVSDVDESSLGDKETDEEFFEREENHFNKDSSGGKEVVETAFKKAEEMMKRYSDVVSN